MCIEMGSPIIAFGMHRAKPTSLFKKITILTFVLALHGQGTFRLWFLSPSRNGFFGHCNLGFRFRCRLPRPPLRSRRRCRWGYPTRDLAHEVALELLVITDAFHCPNGELLMQGRMSTSAKETRGSGVPQHHH
jgi:hypothetical protein